MASVLEVLLDPSVLFGISCIAMVPFVDPTPMTQADVVEYFTHWGMLLSLALLVGTVVVTHQRGTVRLTPYERRVARWYLINGALIHVLLDGLAGGFKVNKFLAAQFHRLDSRYAEPVGEKYASALFLISALELFLKGPVCLYLYACYHRRLPARDVVEVFTCVTQVYGTFIYIGQECLTGFTAWDVDWGLTFSFHHLIYFWFAVFFAVGLYGVVPTYLGYKAALRIIHAQRTK